MDKRADYSDKISSLETGFLFHLEYEFASNN